MNPLQVLAHFKTRQEAIIESIREIVEIESPSGDSERSEAVVLWVENEARKTGAELEIEKISAERFGEHLIIRAFPGDGKPVLLLGHTDTVHPVGSKLANPTRIDGDKFYGCGIFDRSQRRVMLEALRYFRKRHIAGQADHYIMSCDEERSAATPPGAVEREASSRKLFSVEPSPQGV